MFNILTVVYRYDYLCLKVNTSNDADDFLIKKTNLGFLL